MIIAWLPRTSFKGCEDGRSRMRQKSGRERGESKRESCE